MKHAVRTFDIAGKCLHEEFYKTAEAAYDDYLHVINLLNRKLETGKQIIVARYNDEYLMTFEVIKGTH